jgi:Flp pilus assembly protein TadG
MKMKNRGQALVEFAFVAFVFFAILFAAIDFAVMFYVNLTMQHAVRVGTRYAVTGQTINGIPPTPANRLSSMIQVIQNNSNGLYNKNLNPNINPVLSIIHPSNVTFTNYTGTPQSGTTGNPNDIIEVRLTYQWQLLTPLLKPFFPNGRYTFTVRSTMKNESFPTS